MYKAFGTLRASSKLGDGRIRGADGSIYVELTKAVYGLIQAARRWYDTFANAMIEIGYEESV